MHARLKLIIVGDSSSSSPTVNIVQDCVRRLNNNAFRGFDVVVDVVSLDNLISSHSVDLTERSVVLAVISDKVSRLTELHKLTAFGFRVFLIPLGTAEFSGLDCIAAFLAGVLGVVDERYLSMEKVIENLLIFEEGSRRYRQMILIGETASKTLKLKQMLEIWQESDFVK